MPRVVFNGKDLPNWRGLAPHRLPRLAGQQAPVLLLHREAGEVEAEIDASPLAAQPAGYRQCWRMGI